MGGGGTQARDVGRPLRLKEGSEPSPSGIERSGDASRGRGGGGGGGEVDWWTMRKRALNRHTG